MSEHCLYWFVFRGILTLWRIRMKRRSVEALSIWNFILYWLFLCIQKLHATCFLYHLLDLAGRILAWLMSRYSNFKTFKTEIQVHTVNRLKEDVINPNFAEESCFFLVSDCFVCCVRWWMTSGDSYHKTSYIFCPQCTALLNRKWERLPSDGTPRWKNNFQLFNFVTVSLPLLCWTLLQATHAETHNECVS